MCCASGLDGLQARRLPQLQALRCDALARDAGARSYATSHLTRCYTFRLFVASPSDSFRVILSTTTRQLPAQRVVREARTHVSSTRIPRSVAVLRAAGFRRLRQERLQPGGSRLWLHCHLLPQPAGELAGVPVAGARRYAGVQRITATPYRGADRTSSRQTARAELTAIPPPLLRPGQRRRRTRRAPKGACRLRLGPRGRGRLERGGRRRRRRARSCRLWRRRCSGRV